MTHAMEQKIRFIDDYVAKFDEAIKNNNREEAKNLQEEVVGVFSDEVPNIIQNLDNYSHSIYNETPVDFIGDARILKAKLLNYKLNLSSGLYKMVGRNDSGINVTQSVNQDVSTSVDITLSNTFSQINSLSDDILTSQEKEILNGKLAGISAEKDRGNRWEKMGNTLKWIAEKGIEVGTVALPYIVKALEGN